MSPRRKQSTKQLGAILNEAVPRVVAEEVQLPADNPGPSPKAPVTAEEAQNPGARSYSTHEGVSVAQKPADGAQTEWETPADPAISPGLAAQPPSATPAALDSGALPGLVDEEAEAPTAPTPVAPDVEVDSGPLEEPEPSRADEPTSLPAEPLPELKLTFVAEEEDAVFATQPLPGDVVAPGEDVVELPVEPVTWRKSTIPFREDQYDEVGRILAEFRAEHGVQLTIAEFVRLGLDKQIAAFENEETRAGLLTELYEQQLRESQGNENLKHSRSHGLGQYLRQRRP